MIILRKNFSVTDKPTGPLSYTPEFNIASYSARARQFKKETGRKGILVMTDKVKQEFNAWQKEKYGDII